MPGRPPPEFRFLTKDEGTGKLTELGVAWATSKKTIFSVSLDLEGTGERINFMMIKNEPRTAQPAEQPAAPQKPKGRQAKQTDQRPAA